jgi:protein-S-isoprenylcysteine O-methyltransferase Ste14
VTRIPALGPRGEGWVALQIALLVLVAVLGARSLPSAVAQGGGLVGIVVGVLLMSLGGWMVIRGVQSLGASRTAMPFPRDDASLVTGAAYRRVRHPIYIGLMGLAVGWACVTLSPPALVAAALLAVVLDLKARREEAWLTERFPEYPTYLARTNRFIPGVY